MTALGLETAVEARGFGPDPIKVSWGLPTGPRPLQTPPPGPGPGASHVLSVVKMEDGWTQSPLAPASCQLSKWTHSPSATSSQGGDRETRGGQVPSWSPVAQGEAWEHLSSLPVGFSAPPRLCWLMEGGPGCPSQAVTSPLFTHSRLIQQPSIVDTLVLQRFPICQEAGPTT